MNGDRIRHTLWPALVLSCLVCVPARAGGSFAEELGTDAATLAGKVKLSMMNGDQDGNEQGRGPTPYLKALGAPPKRVALVSFYVWDCGNKKENFYNPVYKYKRTINVTGSATDAIANLLYDASIAGFKQGFAQYGIDLLTADEFLDTDEKKQTYANFQMEVGKMMKFFTSIQKSSADNWHATGAPEGYRVLQVATIGDVKNNHFTLGATGIGVGKVAHSLGKDLAGKLGVDAVILIYNVLQAEKKSITMLGSYMYMFGPNPVPEHGQSLYWDGHQYSGDYLRFDVPFITTEKDGALVSADFEGYAVVPHALALRMGEHLKEKATGGK